MKIAFIAGHDGYNLAIANLIKALIKKNHSIDVFASLESEHHIQIFQDNNIPLCDLTTISLSLLEKYDSIFASNDYLQNFDLLNIKKYVFAISDNVLHEPRAGADFIFSNGEKWKENINFPFEKNCAIMETGYLKTNQSSVERKVNDSNTI